MYSDKKVRPMTKYVREEKDNCLHLVLVSGVGVQHSTHNDMTPDLLVRLLARYRVKACLPLLIEEDRSLLHSLGICSYDMGQSTSVSKIYFNLVNLTVSNGFFEICSSAGSKRRLEASLKFWKQCGCYYRTDHQFWSQCSHTRHIKEKRALLYYANNCMLPSSDKTFRRMFEIHCGDDEVKARKNNKTVHSLNGNTDLQRVSNVWRVLVENGLHEDVSYFGTSFAVDLDYMTENYSVGSPIYFCEILPNTIAIFMRIQQGFAICINDEEEDRNDLREWFEIVGTWRGLDQVQRVEIPVDHIRDVESLAHNTYMHSTNGNIGYKIVFKDGKIEVVFCPRAHKMFINYDVLQTRVNLFATRNTKIVYAQGPMDFLVEPIKLFTTKILGFFDSLIKMGIGWACETVCSSFTTAMFKPVKDGFDRIMEMAGQYKLPIMVGCIGLVIYACCQLISAMGEATSWVYSAFFFLINDRAPSSIPRHVMAQSNAGIPVGYRINSGILSTLTGGLDVRNVMLMFGLFRGFKDVGSDLYHNVPWLVNAACHAIYGESSTYFADYPCVRLQEYAKDYQAWADANLEWKIMSHRSEDVYNWSKMFKGKLDKFKLRLTACTGPRMACYKRDLDGLIKAVNEIYEYSCINRPGARVRPIPVVIMAPGQPGNGKTTVLDLMARHVYEASQELLKKLGKPLPDNMTEPFSETGSVYAKAQDSVYVERYPRSFVWKQPEFMSVDDSAEEISRETKFILNAVDSTTYSMNSAFGDKGAVYFVSNLMIVTSNEVDWAGCTKAKDPDAILRRLHFPLKITKKQDIDLTNPTISDLDRGWTIEVMGDKIKNKQGSHSTYSWQPVIKPGIYTYTQIVAAVTLEVVGRLEGIDSVSKAPTISLKDLDFDMSQLFKNSRDRARHVKIVRGIKPPRDSSSSSSDWGKEKCSDEDESVGVFESQGLMEWMFFISFLFKCYEMLTSKNWKDTVAAVVGPDQYNYDDWFTVSWYDIAHEAMTSEDFREGRFRSAGNTDHIRKVLVKKAKARHQFSSERDYTILLCRELAQLFLVNAAFPPPATTDEVAFYNRVRVHVPRGYISDVDADEFAMWRRYVDATCTVPYASTAKPSKTTPQAKFFVHAAGIAGLALGCYVHYRVVKFVRDCIYSLVSWCMGGSQSEKLIPVKNDSGEVIAYTRVLVDSQSDDYVPSSKPKETFEIKRVSGQGGGVYYEDDILSKISNNMSDVAFVGEDDMGHFTTGLFIHSTVFLCTHHPFAVNKVKYINLLQSALSDGSKKVALQFEVKHCGIKVFEDRDLMTITFPPTLSARKDLRSLIPSRNNELRSTYHGVYRLFTGGRTGLPTVCSLDAPLVYLDNPIPAVTSFGSYSKGFSIQCSLVGGGGKAGLCGGVIVVKDNYCRSKRLRCMHVGQDGNDSIVSPFWAEDFEPIVIEANGFAGPLYCGIYDPLEGKNDIVAKRLDHARPGLTYCGELKKPYHVPTDSDFVRSPIHNAIRDTIGIPVIPSVLRRVRLPSGEIFDPHEKSLAKFGQIPGKRVSQSLRAIWDDKIEDFAKSYVRFVDLKYARVLTVEEAIFGIPGLLKALDTDTSVGPDFEALGFTSRSELWKPGWIHPAVFEEVERLEKAMDNGLEIVNVAKACWKSELNTSYKTRMFDACALGVLIQCRRYFALPMLNTKKHLRHCCGKVGISPTSADWKFLYDAFKSKNDNVIAGDCERWDYNVHRIFLYPLWVLYCYMYQIPQSGAQARRLWSLVGSCLGGFLAYKGALYRVHWGVFSGHFMTAFLNTFVHYLMVKIAFEFCKGENLEYFKDKGLLSSSYEELVEGAFYGDDEVQAPAKVLEPVYDSYFVKRIFWEEFGVNYTDPGKGVISQPFLKLDEIAFLGRRFKEFLQPVRTIRAPLGMDSIIGCLCFIRNPKGVTTIAQQLQVNIDTALREMVHHGPKEYNAFCELLSRWGQIGAFPISLSSYEFNASRFLSRYFGEPLSVTNDSLAKSMAVMDALILGNDEADPRIDEKFPMNSDSKIIQLQSDKLTWITDLNGDVSVQTEIEQPFYQFAVTEDYHIVRQDDSNSNVTRNIGPTTILERTYSLGQFTFNLGAAAIVSLNPVRELLGKDPIRSVAEFYRYMSYDSVDVEIRLNSTPMQYGYVLIGAVPWSITDVADQTRYLKFRHNVLDLTSKEALKLTLPRVDNVSLVSLTPNSTSEVFSDNDAWTHSWQLIMSALYTNRLSTDSPTSFSCEVFSKFNNLKFEGPIKRVISQSELAIREEFHDFPGMGGRDLSMVRAAGAGAIGAVATITMPTVIASASSLWSMVSDGWKFIKEAKTAANMAKEVKESLKTTPKDTESYQNNPVGDLATCSPIKGASLLMPYPDCCVYDPNKYGDRAMRHSLRSMISIPTLVGNFFLGAPGTGVIIPCFPNKEGESGSSVEMYGYLPYFSQIFRYWRGSLKYCIVFHTSPFVSARITISVTYNKVTTNLEVGMNPYKQFLLTGMHVEKILVPYSAIADWTPTSMSDTTYSMPFLNVISDDIVSNGDRSPLVYFHIYVMPGDDFEFKSLNYGRIADPVTVEAQGSVMEFCAGEYTPIAGTPKRFMPLTGTTPPYVEDLLARWSFTSRAQDVDTRLVDIAYENNPSVRYRGLNQFIMSCFLFVSGDWDVKLIPADTVANVQKVYMNAAVPNLSVVNERPDNGLVINNYGFNGQTTFRHPFEASVNVLPIGIRTTDNRTYYRTRLSTKRVGLVDVYIAGTTSTQLYHILAPPLEFTWPWYSLTTDTSVTEKVSSKKQLIK